jgi:hypothetical protein
MALGLAAASLVLLSVSNTTACTMAIGYFYQVTALKGRVVGTTFHAPRWLRQSFARTHIKLALYEYRHPWDRTLLVETVETDDHGNFDFGLLKIGHYTLSVDSGGLFDVEVKDSEPVTESVTVDVSPIYPDCTGGHEFIVKNR